MSILIPLYKREHTFPKAIESALAQQGVDFEIVVVDDASPDGSAKLAESYAARDARVRVFRNPSNLGFTGNSRRCLELARGRYVKFLYNDDWFEPTAVARLVAALEAHPDAGFSFSAVSIRFEEDGRTEVRYAGPEGPVETEEYVRARYRDAAPFPSSPCAALFRRDDALAAWESAIPNRLGIDCGARGLGPDLLLFLRMCSKYRTMVRVAEPLVHFRAHAASITFAEQAVVRDLCYDVVLAWYVASAPLSGGMRRRLQGLLFLKSLNRDRLRHLQTRNPWRAFVGLFPPSYRPLGVNLLTRDAWQVVTRRFQKA